MQKAKKHGAKCIHILRHKGGSCLRVYRAPILGPKKFSLLSSRKTRNFVAKVGLATKLIISPAEYPIKNQSQFRSSAACILPNKLILCITSNIVMQIQLMSGTWKCRQGTVEAVYRTRALFVTLYSVFRHLIASFFIQTLQYLSTG